MVKSCTEEEYVALVEGQGKNAPGMFPIEPLLLVVDGIPENQLAIHPPAGHELQLWHRDHSCDHHVDFLLADLLLVRTRGVFTKGLLEIGLEVPHVNVAILLSAIEDFIDVVPGQTVNLGVEVVLKDLLFIVRLGCQHESILYVLPSSHESITRRHEQTLVFVVSQVKDVEHSYFRRDLDVLLTGLNLASSRLLYRRYVDD